MTLLHAAPSFFTLHHRLSLAQSLTSTALTAAQTIAQDAIVLQMKEIDQHEGTQRKLDMIWHAGAMRNLRRRGTWTTGVRPGERLDVLRRSAIWMTSRCLAHGLPSRRNCYPPIGVARHFVVQYSRGRALTSGYSAKFTALVQGATARVSVEKTRECYDLVLNTYKQNCDELMALRGRVAQS